MDIVTSYDAESVSLLKLVCEPEYDLTKVSLLVDVGVRDAVIECDNESPVRVFEGTEILRA